MHAVNAEKMRFTFPCVYPNQQDLLGAIDNAVSDPRLILLDPSTRYYAEAESLMLRSQAWKIGFSDVRVGIDCDSFIDNFTRVYEELVETYSLGRSAEASAAHE